MQQSLVVLQHLNAPRRESFSDLLLDLRIRQQVVRHWLAVSTEHTLMGC